MKPQSKPGWFEVKPPKGLNDPVLGALPEANYTQRAMRVDSGDCLMLYSDGLIEAHHKKDGLFMSTRLIELLNQYPEASIAELKHIVLEEIGRFTGGSLSHDDVTIMMVEIQ
jgi:sigma-B regulation protein RsbU (phosphoserine phosphatase)